MSPSSSKIVTHGTALLDKYFQKKREPSLIEYREMSSISMLKPSQNSQSKSPDGFSSTPISSYRDNVEDLENIKINTYLEQI